ncbi:hypothetical protein BOX15_Mlig001497g1 [Macrostomum lignano]|uniref:Uncharacterized protein n=1 Tax=Macrostomum lignano TaxID=282301 RepID=A0A267EWZ4_9PLAT|nr:hypothetical protein BOX15_Mlig001497g1 [Macrostomum lignano]
MDDLNFFGGVLHAVYAPEFESAEECRLKLKHRCRQVRSGLAMKVTAMATADGSVDQESNIEDAAAPPPPPPPRRRHRHHSISHRPVLQHQHHQLCQLTQQFYKPNWQCQLNYTLQYQALLLLLLDLLVAAIINGRQVLWILRRENLQVPLLVLPGCRLRNIFGKLRVLRDRAQLYPPLAVQISRKLL